MFAGVTCEIWMEPGTGRRRKGRIYREASGPGRVALVLGARERSSSIAPMDVFYKLLVENEVVVLKTNPVNAYLGPRTGRHARSRR